MRKLFFKKKKKTKIYKEHKWIGRALSLAAAICLMAGMMLPVYGSESKESDDRFSNETITEIYHKHIGNSKEMGGCYRISVVHQHQGNEKTGGPCYLTPIYHKHEGNAKEGSGCYTKPVYHQHQGNAQQGGKCYEKITHVHTPECYVQEDCIMYHTPAGEVYETWTDTCYSHKQTTFGKSKGVALHSSCGKEQEERVYSYCLTCGSVSPTTHSYQKLICQMEEGATTGYQLSCGKDETTIEGYHTNCGVAESEITGYALSCEKIVDGYTTGCGLNENQLCGRLILTNETTRWAQQAVLSARLEDLTGGKLKLSTPPYEWRDENGQLIGTGDRITVNENGRYFVVAHLDNKDVDEGGLHGSILVDHIGESQSQASSSPTPEATASATPKATASATPKATASATPKATASATPKAAASATPKATATETPEAAASTTPKDVTPPPVSQTDSTPNDTTQDVSSSGEVDPGAGESTPVLEADIAPDHMDDTKQKGQKPLFIGEIEKSAKQEEISLSPSPKNSPMVKERQNVTLEEYEAQDKITYIRQQEKKHKGFLEIPAVRIIALTGGSLLLIAGILLLFLYLRCSVSIFNDDGAGRMIHLGRCIVKTKDQGYTITITEAMVEKACTNRYCVKPGLFRLGKKEDQELIVHKGTKSVSVSLSREMIVMI